VYQPQNSGNWCLETGQNKMDLNVLLSLWQRTSGDFCPRDKVYQNVTYEMITPMRPASHDDVQCEAVLPNGKRCHFAAEDNFQHCRKHRHLNKSSYEYAIGITTPNIPRGQLFDLTAETTLLKRILAARAQMINDPDSLIIYSGHIADLISKVQKLTEGALKLEQDKHNLIPRTEALQLVGTLMQIVADEVQDINILDKIYQRLDDLIGSLDATT
jgi:hypothetical protein